ncbi:MAG: HDOD domain-containing protein [Deltaproteobacteria bacterium]|nr:HDOD domain-containing protein [Deltaproteobacteria bacterium]MBN2671889.1 HDOD domain-containing protein [Deltaproteobacteria bacterium]
MTVATRSPNWLQFDIESRPQALLDDLASSIKVSPTIQRLMELTQQPDSLIRPVVETLSKSPSLAAEVLKVANSPVYSQGKEIVDLKRAVVLIGMQELHAMTTGLNMLAMFSSDNDVSSTMQDISIVSATIARQLAERMGQDPVSAFLCGLLCEIGALAVNTRDNEEYAKIWKQTNSSPPGRFRKESERYGVPTEVTGSKLLNLNGLPATVSDAIQISWEESAITENILGKITCFSRFAAYVLVDAGMANSREILEMGINRLAEHIELPISSNELIQLCLEAGKKAKLGLLNKIDLYEEALEMKDTAAQAKTRKQQLSDSRVKRFQIYGILLFLIFVSAVFLFIFFKN